MGTGFGEKLMRDQLSEECSNTSCDGKWQGSPRDPGRCPKCKSLARKPDSESHAERDERRAMTARRLNGGTYTRD